MNANNVRDYYKDMPALALEDQDPWTNHRAAMRRHVENDPIEEFLAWSTVRATMYVGVNAALAWEYGRLPEETRLLAGIWGPDLGADRIPGTNLDPNMIHQLYHLQQGGLLNRLHEMKSILEIGGGVGAMYLAARRCGFKGQYVMLDFPEMIALQHYYSQAQGDDQHFAGIFPNGWNPLEGEVDLVIAMASLSEAPLSQRDLLINIPSDEFLIYYQDHYNGIDNKKYFMEWVNDKMLMGYRGHVINGVYSDGSYISVKKETGEIYQREEESENGKA